MKSAGPLLQLTGYYLVIVLIVAIILVAWPSAIEHVPLGGNGNLSMDAVDFTTGKAVPVDWEPLSKALDLLLGLSGALLSMIPVAWVYMGVRRRRGREQSFVVTLLMLPLAVAGIVIIVENSLALAFSLAGIVAGVRFRLTLDDTLDAIFIFLSIGVGLAAGIGALEIAFVLTGFFNYILLVLWQVSYAEATSINRWFTQDWMNTGDNEPLSNDETGTDTGTDRQP